MAVARSRVAVEAEELAQPRHSALVGQSIPHMLDQWRQMADHCNQAQKIPESAGVWRTNKARGVSNSGCTKSGTNFVRENVDLLLPLIKIKWMQSLHLRSFQNHTTRCRSENIELAKYYVKNRMENIASDQ